MKTGAAPSYFYSDTNAPSSGAIWAGSAKTQRKKRQKGRTRLSDRDNLRSRIGRKGGRRTEKGSSAKISRQGGDRDMQGGERGASFWASRGRWMPGIDRSVYISKKRIEEIYMRLGELRDIDIDFESLRVGLCNGRPECFIAAVSTRRRNCANGA